MTASQRVCQTTNIVSEVAPPTRRARSNATQLLMNAKIGVHALRTVLGGVISVQVDFVVAKIPTRVRKFFNAREKLGHFILTLRNLEFSRKRKFLKESILCV